MARVWADVERMFADKGATNYDPNVTQIGHALQSASLAKKEGASPALVVAALLHDFGHLVLDEHSGSETFLQKDLEHEKVGYEWLKKYFGPEVSLPVLHHVPAKRYLCGTDTAYWSGLSDASKHSLVVQGGPFTADEAAAWIEQPGAKAAVRVRLWDDQAKVKGLVAEGLATFKDDVIAAAASASSGGTPAAGASSPVVAAPAAATAAASFGATTEQEMAGYLLNRLSPAQKASYDRHGFVKIPQVLSHEEILLLKAWVAEVEALELSVDKWMHHLEETPAGPRMSRTENFASYHSGLSRLLMAGTLPQLAGVPEIVPRFTTAFAFSEGSAFACGMSSAGDAMGEPVFLFKEKINYKHPGGGGCGPRLQLGRSA
jgi:predicted HD phosphohydrolase